MPDRTASSSLAVVGMWVALAVVPFGALAWTLTGDDMSTSVALELTNDAGTSALFSAEPGFAPGASRSACLSVGAAGAGPEDEVRFLVQDLTGTLAPQLQVDVYVGTGAAYPDCAGFAGSRVYRGTLDGLAALSDQGVASGWRPGSSSRRSFKFVVTLADGAVGAGTRAGATFVWRLGAGSTVPTPTPTAEPTSGSNPGPGPTAGPAPTTTPAGAPDEGYGNQAMTPSSTGSGPDPATSAGGGATGGPATPGATGSGSAPGSGSGDGSEGGNGNGNGGAGSGSGSGSDDPDLSLARTVPAQVGRTVIGVLAEPQFTLTPLLLVLVFMLIQHRIDARDPKLADASRTRRDLTVAFPDGSAEVDPR